jgi:transglutaminase-like putative cysteine protease
VSGLTSTQAGFSDSLDLAAGGPILSNNEVVLRVLPLEEDRRPALEGTLALLRGITLEALEGQRWTTHMTTPPLPYASTEALGGQATLEYFVAPSPQGILPLPYGRVTVQRLPGMPLFGGPGASLRWMYPTRRPMALSFRLEPSAAPDGSLPRGRRWALLTATGAGTESAERFSRRVVPGEAPAEVLAQRLSEALQRFGYTLDNPSGNAANPLQDFLEVSQAGHCEYFASSLALMLRYRGIPARVVNGYRLGPWIPEGGYWLVTQNEAHSWVEYYDAQAGRWRVADPTPAGSVEAATFWTAFQRWTDAVRFRWDRHVVRFSDEDQLAGLQWFQARISDLPSWRPDRSSLFYGLGVLLAGIAGWRFSRSRPWRRWLAAATPSGHGLKPLAPLLRAAGRPLQPAAGETARQWLRRLAERLPERAEPLARVAEEADAVAYGGQEAARLKALAKLEAKALRRLRR